MYSGRISQSFILHYCTLAVGLLFLTTLTLMTQPGQGAKILITALPGYSHIFAMSALSKQLARQGHQVHYMVGASFKVPIDPNTPNITIERYGSPDFKPIDYELVMTKMTEQILGTDGKLTDLQNLLGQFFDDDSEQLLVHSEDLFDKFEKMKFDLAIIDGIFIVNYQYLAPHRLRIPYVTVSFIVNAWDIPSPLLPSFVPSKVSSYSDVMTFPERLMNIFFTLVPYLQKGKDPSEEILDRYRKYGNFQTSHDLVSKSLMFFTTCDPVMDYGMALPPNTIRAGGLTVHPASGRPLPEEIEKFISAPNEGVILMTFGTLAKNVPRALANKFIDAFTRLSKYRIIWRLENKDNLEMPENVMVSPWLPQNDLLADKRINLFITHCGNNGQFEALYHAVPMIGFPIFVDQGYNAKRIVAHGFGIEMNIHEFNSDQLIENIEKIMLDKSYKDRISKASEIYRSADRTPVERVGYWVDHVLKFGADHLRPSGTHLSVMQYLMLDVLAFVAVVVVLAITLVWFILKFIFRLLCRKPSQKSKVVNGKKKN